jgi:hypothetical protein
MLAEANVSDDELREYFGQADGTSTRVLVVFAFRLNQAMVLSLAREDRRPVAATLRELPDLPRHGQWVTFLRNHDEIDLGRLTEEERQEVFRTEQPPLNFAADSDYGNDVDLDDVHVAGYGYRWIRLRRRIGGLPWTRISSPGGSAA